MGKASAPTPPNPITTAAAQTGTNVSTAIANAFLNNTNQVTPLGSLAYQPTSYYSWTDPSTGSTYEVPQFTAYQQLGSQEQRIQNQTEQAKENLAGLSNQQSSRLQSLLGSPIDLSGAPARVNTTDTLLHGTAMADPDYTYASYGRAQYDPGDAGAITTSYGPGDFSADRSHVEDALFGRLNPQLQIEKSNLAQQLADQGIKYGSTAYNNAMDNYNRQANDARLAVTQTAGQEQQRMMDMAAQRAGFENSAQQQRFSQLMGRAQFYNQALGQDTGDIATRAAFANSALSQTLNQNQMLLSANALARQQYLQEMYAQRNQPINEITALLGGSQVSSPNLGLTQPTQQQIPTTDIAQLINQNYNQQYQNYQSQLNQQNQIIGGLFGLGGGLIKGGYLSDRTEKENIHRIGSVFAPPQAVQDVDSDEAPGQHDKLPMYSYSYKSDPTSTRHIGPMAQDVEKVAPQAVFTRGGKKHIEAGYMGRIFAAA